MNDHLILINGISGTGKSTSLMGIKDQERWAYANCEAGKRLPFKSKFKQAVITNPLQVPENITGISGNENLDGLIVDSLSFLMEMYESQFVIGSANSMAMWGEYAQFFKNMMQVNVAQSDKTIIFTSHVDDVFDENSGDRSSQAVVKGALKKLSIESFFSCVISCKKMKVTQIEKELEDMGCEKDANGNWSEFLNISDKERRLNMKFVFQTEVTSKTLHERIRSPLGMWNENELYIDNNVQHLLDRLAEYYE